MLFEPGQSPGYEPPSKKSRECPESSPGPLDCSKPENNGADLRIRQVRGHILRLDAVIIMLSESNYRLYLHLRMICQRFS